VTGDPPESSTLSFWVSGLCSPFVSFGDRVRSYLEAIALSDDAMIQTAMNAGFGELYAPGGRDIREWQQVAMRRQPYRFGEVPIETIKAGFGKAKTLLGKRKLARAKAAVASYQGANVVVLRRGTPTADLGSLRREDREFDKKLTLAARNGGADVEADAAGIEEDLAELDAWKDEDGKDS
jgi:Phage terminase large subunit (GpA)